MSGLYVRGQVEGHPITFLIDTGSSETVISPAELLSVTQPVRQADGKTLPVQGYAMMNLAVGGQSAVVDVIVADLRTDGKMGMNYLLTATRVINLDRLHLTVDRHTIQCTGNNNVPFHQQVMVMDTVIPAGQAEILRVA